MLARTLTQAALPSTIGAKTANWLTGVLDAADTVAALPPLTAQTGGAAGTHCRRNRTDRFAGRRARPVRRVRVGRRPRGRPRRGTRRGRRSPEPAMPWSAAATHGDTSRTTSRPAAGPRSASSPRAARGRLVDDAAQGQPGAVGADPPRRADGARARRHAAHRVRRRVSTNAPTAAGTPNGPPCAR